MKLIKRLLFIIIIALAIYAGYLLKQQGTGFVLIQYQDFSIETSVFVFTGFIIALFFIVYFLLRSFLNLIKIPDFIQRSYTSYQNRKSSSGLVAGLIEFTEGRFKKAENLLIKQASDNKNSFLNYLLAARAAQLLHADNRRDSYLKQAHEINPDADLAIGLTQAELQLSHQQNEMALATLNQLITSNPKHDYAMQLMARAYLQLEDWSHLCPLLNDLRQSKTLPEEALKKSEHVAYSGYLQQTGELNDISKLQSIWQGMPKYLKQDQDFIGQYVKQLISNAQLSAAEQIIRDALNKKWNDQLIDIYASFINQIETDNNERYYNSLLVNCEKWLSNNPHHATLLLTAGKICTALKLWGKARSYFDSSLSCMPQADTYLQLAMLLENTGEVEQAQNYYQQGLTFCLTTKS